MPKTPTKLAVYRDESGDFFVRAHAKGSKQPQGSQPVKVFDLNSRLDLFALRILIRSVFEGAEDGLADDVYEHLFRKLYGGKFSKLEEHDILPPLPETKAEYEARLARYEQFSSNP